MPTSEEFESAQKQTDARKAAAEEEQETSDTSEAVVQSATFPFRFNPQVHPTLRHRGVPSLYKENTSDYGPNSSTNGTFQNLRLGRIVMGERTLSIAMKTKKTRYGFRFLYNPTSVTGGANINTQFIPDPSDTIGGILQSGLEQISFELLLNRTPDVQGNAPRSSYSPSLSDEDYDGIRERGTHYDLEFLYRVANGVHATQQRQETGDIGILLPNPCDLFLGPFKSRGALMSISATDQMFSDDLVPILTFVQVSFARYMTPLSAEDTETLASTGVYVSDYAPGGSSDSRTDPDSPNYSPAAGGEPSGAAMDPNEIEKIARQVGFSKVTAEYLVSIAWYESGWVPGAYNGKGDDRSYGLYQINLHPNANNLDTLKQNVKGLNTANDLYDPLINTRAAWYLSRGGSRQPGDNSSWWPWTTKDKARNSPKEY